MPRPDVTRPHVPCPLDDLNPEQMARRRFDQGDLSLLKDWEIRHFRAQDEERSFLDRWF